MSPPLHRLIDNRIMRSAIDIGARCLARRRTQTLDNMNVATTQRQSLLQLVRRAEDTRFGRDHGFSQIRSVADYRRQVPLRTYENLWQDYWQPSFPRLTNATWPGVVRYLAQSSGTTSGSTKFVPVTHAMLRSNRRAATTALSWRLSTCPNMNLFQGKLLFLGGSTDLQPAVGPREQHGPLTGDLSGIAAKEISPCWRPFTFPSLDVALMTDWEQKLSVLAKRSATEPITFVSGVPSWLLAFFEQLRRATGKSTISEIWPQLRLVFHGGTRFDPYREQFRRIIGNDAVQYSDVYAASEGFIAAEDPRSGLLRLVPDHGIFFEFVPAAEIASAHPTRHDISEVELGVQYAVVVSTCAGLWSYVLGDTVCFEERDPPLLRFTGRIKQFLSAFGEHLIGEEVERAVARAAQRMDAAITDFHVGPVFPESAREAGFHRYFVEFSEGPPNLEAFAVELDSILAKLNDDYRAHRAGDITLARPDVCAVPRGGFADWMRARGKLGGQHKVPRLDNTGELAADLARWFAMETRHALSTSH